MLGNQRSNLIRGLPMSISISISYQYRGCECASVDNIFCPLGVLAGAVYLNCIITGVFFISSHPQCWNICQDNLLCVPWLWLFEFHSPVFIVREPHESFLPVRVIKLFISCWACTPGASCQHFPLLYSAAYCKGATRTTLLVPDVSLLNVCVLHPVQAKYH